MLNWLLNLRGLTNVQKDFDRIHAKLDAIDTKLDSHLDRIGKAETSIEWIRGHITIGLTIAIPASFGMRMV